MKGRHSQTLKWEGHGLKLSIPEGAVLSESVILIKASLAGQFELPPGAQLVSPVYWLCCGDDFQLPVTLELQHCATIKHQSQHSSLSFIVAKCSQEELPYKFKLLDKGTFSQHSSHGSINVKRFSLFGIVETIMQFFVYSPQPRSYYAQLFYQSDGDSSWRLHFVITWNLEACLTVSNNILWHNYACMHVFVAIVFFVCRISSKNIHQWILKKALTQNLSLKRRVFLWPFQRMVPLMAGPSLHKIY